MATATFYTTAKRHNSTLIPTAGADYDVVLKNGCDIITPTFYMQLNRVPNWSMLKFEGRYYFITGITSLRQDYWQIDADVDVLATYKTDIQGTTEFILYDSTVNTEIVDNRLPTKTTPVYAENNVILNENASAAGSYLCCATGEGSSEIYKIPNVSWLSNIIADPTHGLRHYIDDEYQSSTWSDWTEAVAEYLRTTGKNIITSGGNVFNNIRSIIWVPWRVETTQNKLFYLGPWYSGASADVVTTIFQRTSAQVAIPWQFSDWRRNEPYTYIYLYIPFVGVIHIPSSQVIDQSVIDVQIAFNQQNGEIAFRVYSGNVQIGAYGANTAVAIPFGACQITPAQKLTAVTGSAAGVAAAIASGNVVAGAAAAASLAALRPIGATVGGIGGGAGGALDLQLRCFTISHDTIVAPNSIAATIGTPTMAQQSLANKTGYVQTQAASVSGSMTDTERNRINSLLNGGIYIE